MELKAPPGIPGDEARWIRIEIPSPLRGNPWRHVWREPLRMGAAFRERDSSLDYWIPILLNFAVVVLSPAIIASGTHLLMFKSWVNPIPLVPHYFAMFGLLILGYLVLARVVLTLQEKLNGEATYNSTLKALLWGTMPIAGALAVWYATPNTFVIVDVPEFRILNDEILTPKIAAIALLGSVAKLIMLLGTIPSIIMSSHLLGGVCRLTRWHGFCLAVTALPVAVLALALLGPLLMVVFFMTAILFVTSPALLTVIGPAVAIFLIYQNASGRITKAYHGELNEDDE